MKKRAVILFNLGGPNSLNAVKPFLFNLFADKNIIPLPAIFRYPLAFLISRLRNVKAQKIYAKIGGKSPIEAETRAQADCLEKKLNRHGTDVFYRTFIAMRYWSPRLHEILPEIQNFDPDEIILVPLYPQFSTTTTKSSFEEWDRIATKVFEKKITKRICCYFEKTGLIEAHTILIRDTLLKRKSNQIEYEILLSAHGIPISCIEKGDPYQFQVEKTGKAIAESLQKIGINHPVRVTYQSKVGPAKWLTPSTEKVIEELSEKKKGIVVVPVAFVSEHSETLVELDFDYANLAKEKGAADYLRVPALGTNEVFIDSLMKMILEEPDPSICDQKYSACFKRACKKITF